MSLFRIRITDTKYFNPLRREPVYVAERPEWDGSWYTREPRKAREYKTRNGAQRWLDERPEIEGAVEEK